MAGDEVVEIGRLVRTGRWVPSPPETAMAAELDQARGAVALWPELPDPPAPPGSPWGPAPWTVQYLVWTAAVVAATDRVAAGHPQVPHGSPMRTLVRAYATAGRPVVAHARAAAAAWRAEPAALPSAEVVAEHARQLRIPPERAAEQLIHEAVTTWQEQHLPTGAEQAADRAARRMWSVRSTLDAATGHSPP